MQQIINPKHQLLISNPPEYLFDKVEQTNISKAGILPKCIKDLLRMPSILMNIYSREIWVLD